MLTAVILAAGIGKRMGTKENKVFLRLADPIIEHSVRVFEETPEVDDIIIVCNEIEKIQDLSKKFRKVSKIIVGGKTRQKSSYNGVHAAVGDIILVHDAARPLVKKDDIRRLIADCIEHGAAILAVPVKDTIKQGNGVIKKTIEREDLWIAQTPQAFRTQIIMKSHEKALSDRFEGTDEASLVEHAGYKVKLTLGSYDNIKITTPEDLMIARMILKTR